MNKKNRRKLSLIFGSFFAASAIAAAITLPIIFTNQYNDKDKNSNQNFNDLVNKILSNKKSDFYKADNKILPQQLTTDNILEYTNLPKKDFSKNINIVYTINSVDNTNGSANITMNVIEGTDNIAISNIEISGFRTYAEQLNLNSNLFSNLELQGNDKLVPALLTEENIEANLDNLPSPLYGIKYNFSLSNPNNIEGTISISIDLTIGNLSKKINFVAVKGFLTQSQILTTQIFKNSDSIFQNFNNILNPFGHWTYSYFFTSLKSENGTAITLSPINLSDSGNFPTPAPITAAAFKSANSVYNSNEDTLTFNFVTNEVFGYSNMSYQTFGAIAKSGFLLEPAGTTISISFNLKNYDLDFTKSGEVNFKVSSTALNPNTQWPLTIVISKSFYFDNSGNLYNKDINQNYIDENKSKSKEIDNISADLKFYSDSSYNNTIPFKLNY